MGEAYVGERLSVATDAVQTLLADVISRALSTVNTWSRCFGGFSSKYTTKKQDQSVSINYEVTELVVC